MSQSRTITPLSPSCLLNEITLRENALSNLSAGDQENFYAFGTGPSTRPAFPTVLAAIEHNTRFYPDLIAVEMVTESGAIDGNLSISYKELDAKAGIIADALRSRGIVKGDRVGLFLQRSLEMVIGIVGILKVGGAYIPQDARVAPAKQLLSVSAEAGVSVVLSTSKFSTGLLPKFSDDTDIIAIDDVLAARDSTFPRSEPQGDQQATDVGLFTKKVDPDDVCYIIFTSGTTGAPKGVQVTHGNVSNVLMTPPMNLGMRPGVKVSQILSVSFDMAAWEILGSLCNGATLVIRHRSIRDAVKLADIVIATPTILTMLDSAEMGHIETAAVAGEPCPRPLADTWSKFCTFYNSCGPTEVTIINTAQLHNPHKKVLTIGKPTPNNTVYILDPQNQTPLPIGAVGEMWGGGRCVSKGYLGKPELTALKYKLDPFIGDGKAMMYRTGDLGRWNSDGELEHFGRVDDQVKVKGFRVELDGVASAIESASSVNKAVSIKFEKGIMAFVTPEEALEDECKIVVCEKLPYYCIPDRVFSLSEFPTTRNGKVDKRALAKYATTSTKERSSTSASKKPESHLFMRMSHPSLGG